jgi:cytochrome d ubiquinol oxidase subunit I
VAEVGRQPWIVNGLMRTKDAVSPLDPSQVLISLAAFILVYSFLGILDIWLLAKNAKKGPIS